MVGGIARTAGTVRRERKRAVVNLKPESTEPAGAAEWIVVDFDRRGFRCDRCGATEQHSSPRGVSRLDAFALRGRAFALEHGSCTTASAGK